MGGVDMAEERCCRTCVHYDPEDGMCSKFYSRKYSFEGEKCAAWEDWENRFYGPKYKYKDGGGK